MFGSSFINGGLSMSKVLGGISKSLSIVNQLIPLYKQAKPTIDNVKNIYSSFKSNYKKNSVSNNPKNEVNIKNIELKSKKFNNSPMFFQ